MGKAFKCDRCGSLFERKREYEQIVIKANHKPFAVTLDICPECMQDFEKWRNMEK